MYNHNKAQQSRNRVHISWDILYHTLLNFSFFESESQFFRCELKQYLFTINCSRMGSYCTLACLNIVIMLTRTYIYMYISFIIFMARSPNGSYYNKPCFIPSTICSDKHPRVPCPDNHTRQKLHLKMIFHPRCPQCCIMWVWNFQNTLELNRRLCNYSSVKIRNKWSI